MTCIAVKTKIYVYEGGTYDEVPFSWYENDGTTPVDLTGYTAAMTIRAKNADTTALVSITHKAGVWSADCDSGVYFEDAALGKYRIYIKDNDTVGICAAHKDIDGVYDLFLYSPAGESVLKQYGVAKLYAAVTR